MPGSTPIYGFPYPLGSDPVSDGDSVIRELAEDVETVIAGNVGLAKVGAGTFTNTVEFDITGFNALPVNISRMYRLIISAKRLAPGTGTTSFAARLNNAGTNITPGYFQGGSYTEFNGVTGTQFLRNNAVSWLWGFGENFQSQPESIYTFDLWGASGLGMSWTSLGYSFGQFRTWYLGGHNQTTSAYDRVRINFDPGTLASGYWALYAYR